jgi:hypothetical protein
MATMDARLKRSWLPATAVIFGLVLLIGVVEDRLSARGRGMWLMLGIVVVGFAGIFIWTYFHREPPPKQSHPISGKQQTVNLVVDPQLGVFYHEQRQSDHEVRSELFEREKHL